jgi:hypothetical protein
MFRPNGGMMRPLSTQMHERSFGVSAPNVSFESMQTLPAAPSDATEPEPLDLQTVVLRRLMALKPESEELRGERQQIISQLIPLLAQADQLMINVGEERSTNLKTRADQLRKQCRTQQKECTRLRAILDAKEIALRNAIESHNEERDRLSSLRDMERRREHVPQWPSDQELAAWQARVELVVQKLSAANQCMAEALNEREAARNAVEPAQQKMQELATEELRVRSQLTGASYVDLEYGISTVPEKL